MHRPTAHNTSYKSLLVTLAMGSAMMLSIASMADSGTHILDWVPRDELTEQQREALTPGSCGAYIAPLREDADASLEPTTAPTRATANKSTLSQTSPTTRTIVLVGDVLITQGYRQLAADKAQLDEAQGTLVMDGNLSLREPGLLVLGDASLVNQQQNTLRIDNATYALQTHSIRGSAGQIQKTTDNSLTLTQADFTQCEPGNNTWLLKGSQIILDSNTRQGHAKHVRLIVKGIPVFYFPYLRFPLGDQRMTGFLAPTFSYGDDGTDIAVPFYFNLAPNYDWLFTPNFLEAHGVLYENNIRHLSQHFSTTINAAHLSNDKGKLNKDDQQLIDDNLTTEAELVPFKGEDRWVINVDQNGGEDQAWSTRIDYTHASDIDYFRDFDTNTGSAHNDNYLNQKILAAYTTVHWAFGLDAIRYQTLSESITEPYKQVPALSADGSYDWDRWSLTLKHEWIRFDHEDADAASRKLTGDRLRSEYSFGWNFEPEWGFLRPVLQAKHLQYRFDDNNFAANADRSPSITVPQMLIDSGLFFERNTDTYLQTFEPRLFYFYSDFQDHSPLFDVTTNNQDVDFDTAALSFSYNQLFRDTRFSGGDRIDDANQLAVGLTTRFFGNQSGREWFSASLGQITYFDDRRVTLTNTPNTESRSALAGQISANPSADWRLSSDLLYDDIENQLDKGTVKLRYQNDYKHLFELGYGYTRGSTDDNSIKQINGALIAPLFNDRWHLLVYSAYDNVRNRELETLGAIEYNGCCYRLRVGYRSELDDRLITSVPEDELRYDYSAFIELHLKGLGGTGKQLDNLLNENIDGYTEWQAIYQQ